MLVYVIIICIIYPIQIVLPRICNMLMNLDVTNALGLDGEVGHYLARPLYK
jgi:hypothetical protein